MHLDFSAKDRCVSFPGEIVAAKTPCFSPSLQSVKLGINDEANVDLIEMDLPIIPLSEARSIISDSSQPTAEESTASFVRVVVASHSICESPEATLQDLVACASSKIRSAAWRPAHLLHERTGVPKCLGEYGLILIDPAFWQGYVGRLQNSDDNTSNA